MKECKKGQWVEISKMILEAGRRAKGVPEDTGCVPLMCWIGGWAVTGGIVGKEIEIVTPVGRKVKGILAEVNPSYQHSFGPVVPELAGIGQELSGLLKGDVLDERN